jgi:hypothetical protein
MISKQFALLFKRVNVTSDIDLLRAAGSLPVGIVSRDVVEENRDLVSQYCQQDGNDNLEPAIFDHAFLRGNAPNSCYGESAISE